MANIIASLFIVLTISVERRFGADTPTNTSAPLIESAKVPFSLLGLVILEISTKDGSVYSLFLSIIPSLLNITIFFTPKLNKSFAIATPAAPAPLITTFKSEGSFLIIFKAFIIPAKTTIAVPCWSS